MKMKKLVAVLLAVLMFVTVFAACGKKPAEENKPSETPKQKFVMGIDSEYPPFSYIDANGEYTGFDVEVCQAACEYLGWEFKVFSVNWDNKLIQLDAKECDCVWSGMTILPSMKEAGYVISQPYYDNEQVLVVKENSGFNSSKDLAGKDVAVMLGTSGEALLGEDGDLNDLAKTFKKVITCESFLKCFTELEGGAVDAVFVDMPVAATYVAEHKGYKLIDEDFGAEQYGIAFRSTDAELCAKIEGAVAALVESGKYKEIADKYEDIDNSKLLLLNK